LLSQTKSNEAAQDKVTNELTNKQIGRDNCTTANNNEMIDINAYNIQR